MAGIACYTVYPDPDMKSYLYLLLTLLSAGVILLLVFHFGDIPNRYKNGFKRKYFPGACVAVRKIDRKDTLHEIIGTTPWNIYITTATEGEVLQLSRGPDNTVRRLKIPFFTRFYDSLGLSNLSIKIDSPYIYLFAENKPAIIKTSFDSGSFEVRVLPPGPFTREAMAGADCFILRKFDPRITDQVFVRYTFSTGSLKKEDGISQVYGDGGIITDGQLHFDPETKKLYYIYFYKNLLLAFDTALTITNRFFSIDTVGSFKIRTAMVRNEGTAAFTNVTPAHVINKANDVRQGLLFNMSALKADNESDKFFSDNSILDVVDLKTGVYRGSIYLPVLNGSKLSRFIASDSSVIGLYTNSVVFYDLRPGLHR